jgi:outer membrane protein TolC
VESAYWELYAAERDLAVQKLIRDRARSIHEEAETRARVGLVGPGQVANAKVFLAEQEQALLDAEDRLDDLSDRLGALIGRRPGAGQTRFRPADDPPHDFPVEPADTLVARATRNNLALRSLDRRAAALEAVARGAAWDALPSVDLVASLGGNALAGKPQDIIFGGDTLRVEEKGGWNDLLDEALTRKHPTWSAGLRVTVPLTLREGRGERMRARAEAARAREELEAARRGVERQVRALWRELSRSDERLRLAREGVDASLEQVRIGVLEYRAGAITVPSEAVFVEGSQAFVYLIKPDSMVTRTPVGLGTRLADAVEIVTGLSPGAMVVRSGHQKLYEGAKVAPIMKPAESAGAESAGGAAPPESAGSGSEGRP